MSMSFSRRKMLSAGGAAALAPAATIHSLAPQIVFPSVVTGPVFVLIEPLRVFDSRTAHPALGGGKLVAGNSIGIPVGGVVDDGNPAAVYVNVTITDTEGAGYLVIRASDLTGERPFPQTSNINWSARGQTLANLVFTAVGGENTLQIYAGGVGRTHFILDVLGYIPVPT